MNKSNAINFLLYSYFEITLESTLDEIMEAAIRTAYKDASSHVLSIDTEENNYNTKNKAIEQMRIEIGKLLNNIEGESYVQWHGDLCTYLKNIYKDITCDERCFTYGIAQKWVNMTMKYLCIINSIYKEYVEEYDNEISVLNNIEIIENELHVPVDSFILESASKIGKQNNKHGFEIKIPNKKTYKRNKVEICMDDRMGHYSSEKSLPWSKWDFDSEEWKSQTNYYLEFQNSIKSEVEKTGKRSRIDWEGPAWIEIASDRKKKEMKTLEKKYGKERL